MKKCLLVCFFLTGCTIVPTATFAGDPSIFLNVLGVDVEGLRSRDGDFFQVKNLLGMTKQIDRGDAADYEGRVEYVLHDRSQMITFLVKECRRGYRIERTVEKKSRDKTVMKPLVKELMAGKLYLGMDMNDVKRVFGGTTGNWKIEEAKRKNTTWEYIYHKTVEGKDSLGNPGKWCVRIWINLNFDRNRKLNLVDVTTGGCDDSPCGDD